MAGAGERPGRSGDPGFRRQALERILTHDADSDRVTRTLEDLGKELGAAFVNHSLIIPFDGFYECVLTPARGAGRVVMEAPLLIVAGSSRSDLLRRAMRLNADPSQVAGGILYLDRETDALVMRAETPIGAEGGAGLSQAVANFIETARRFLERSAAGDAREAPEPEPWLREMLLRC